MPDDDQKISIEFRTDEYWFLLEGKVFYSFEKKQLRDWQDTRCMPRNSSDRFRFSETFDDDVVGEPTLDHWAGSGLIAFETDGQCVMIFDRSKELK